jgi:hypothetical protein
MLFDLGDLDRPGSLRGRVRGLALWGRLKCGLLKK